MNRTRVVRGFIEECVVTGAKKARHLALLTILRLTIPRSSGQRKTQNESEALKKGNSNEVMG